MEGSWAVGKPRTKGFTGSSLQFEDCMEVSDMNAILVTRIQLPLPVPGAVGPFLAIPRLRVVTNYNAL